MAQECKYIHTYIHTYIHAYIHTVTYIHTRVLYINVRGEGTAVFNCLRVRMLSLKGVVLLSEQGRTQREGPGARALPLGPIQQWIFRISSVKVRHFIFA